MFRHIDECVGEPINRYTSRKSSIDTSTVDADDETLQLAIEESLKASKIECQFCKTGFKSQDDSIKLINVWKLMVKEKKIHLTKIEITFLPTLDPRLLTNPLKT